MIEHPVNQDNAIDTTFELVNGTVSFELPVEKVAATVIGTDGGEMEFVSDGSKLSFVIDSTGKPAFKNVSKSKINSELEGFSDFSKSISDSLMHFSEALDADSSLSDEEKEDKLYALYDALDSTNATYGYGLAKNNPDNYLAVAGLRALLYSEVYDDSTKAELINGLSDDVKNAWPAIGQSLKSIEARSATAEGMKFTDFEVETTPGVKDRLSNYVGKGKYTIVDFWASWCGPCKGEIPYLKDVYSTYKGKNFDQLSVAVWEKDPQASLDTAAAYGINWNHMINAQAIPTEIYGIEGIPHIILFGPDGTILKRNLRGDDIAKEVGKYVQPGGELVK
jgi:thiol-disulfide isomerase/thioredoxin